MLSTGRFAGHFEGDSGEEFVPGTDDGYWRTSLEVQPANPDVPKENEYFVPGEPVNPADESQGDGPETAAAPEPAPEKPKASSSAFVLVIVGLVLSILFFTCIPGIVCSIIGLVLNARNNKTGLENPRRTSTNIVGVIGLIVGAVALCGLIFLGVVAKQVVDTVNENGWDISEVQIIRAPDGSLVIREHSGAAAGSTPVGVLPASSGSASSNAAATSASSESSSTGSASSSAASSSSSGNVAAFDPACLDAAGNPTLYALFELSGSQLQSLLKADGFGWYEEITAWMRANNTIFEMVDRSGSVSRSDIDTYAVGAAGAPVVMVLSVEGYATPAAALDGLGANVSIGRRYEDDGAMFAVVSGSNGDQHLVLVTDTGNGEQTVLVYGEAAIKDGLFQSTIGIDVGSSIDEAWDIITG